MLILLTHRMNDKTDGLRQLQSDLTAFLVLQVLKPEVTPSDFFYVCKMQLQRLFAAKIA